ncbi:MAG: putative selenium-dependent hydroxylase accessory protein YqeC [Hespellia sp.]|nr:putative selenium-dependent hydroxylase accessory protein YqeC [Hespellia sp.]
MIYSYENGRFTEQRSLLATFGLGDFSHPVISVVGAGGKTTLVMRLKEEYRSNGERVVVTTTTHMREPDLDAFLSEPSKKRMQQILNQEGWVFAGFPVGNGKVSMMPEWFLNELLAEKIPVLIEADGARNLPLKFPAAWEPVLHPATNVVLGVMGLDAVGCMFAEVCFRSELAAEYLHKRPADPISCEDLCRIGLSIWGLRKDVREGMRFHIILNKADTRKRREYGEEIARRMAEKGFGNVHLTVGLGDDNESIDQRRG